MIADNKDLKTCSLAELNEQYIYAVRHVHEWMKKLNEVEQPDSKMVCLREIDYWNNRRLAIQRIFVHVNR